MEIELATIALQDEAEVKARIAMIDEDILMTMKEIGITKDQLNFLTLEELAILQSLNIAKNDEAQGNKQYIVKETICDCRKRSNFR